MQQCHCGQATVLYAAHYTGELWSNEVKLLIILWNKASSDYSFISLSPIVTIFIIPVHSAIVDMSNDLVAVKTISAANYVLPYLPKYYIIK